MSQFHTYERSETKFVIPCSVSAVVQSNIEDLLVNGDTGGFTRHSAIGAWRGEREIVTIYTVAGLAFTTLHLIADMMLADGQTDIYCVLPDGRACWFDNKLDYVEGKAARDYEAERKRERLSDIYK